MTGASSDEVRRPVAGSMRRVFQLFSGARNRFLVLPEEEGDVRWGRLAPGLCARGLFDDKSADGLLLIDPTGSVTDARMTLWNADGSRPEACGNGLRCVAWWLFRSGSMGPRRIATDSGVREVEVIETRGDRDRARVWAQMGRAELFPLSAPLPGPGAELSAVGVRIGNPHCVLLVPDERYAAVEELGRALQTHPDFPEGVNVGFLARRDGRWFLRVHERGVGETEACGTGACAAAAVIGEEGGTEIEMPGGVLEIRSARGGMIELLGDAVFHGEVELEVSPEERVAPRRS